MFWFDRENPNVTYIDNREYSDVLCDGRALTVKPDLIADFRNMPFADNTFYHVVFNPPHLLNIGESAWMAKKYGKLGINWRDDISAGFRECFRVLKPFGTLVFKWNEQQIPLKDVLALAEYLPLYGNKRSKTHWITFIKS